MADAYEGYALSKGIAKPAAEPWTQEDLDELDRMIREDEKRMAKLAGNV